MKHAFPLALSLGLCLSAFASDAPRQAKIVKVLNETEPQRHESTRMRTISPNEVGKFKELRDDFAPKPAGAYITAIWETYSREPLQSVTVKLTYRQTNLPEPQSTSIQMNQVKHGTTYSEFQIIGDAYTKGGPITAWKLEVVSGGQVLDTFHSFLWKDPS
ncbi:MAG: hypothetical protein EXS18_06920 [Verrucomicrobiae bacterium]|nr:hypothetical protein [Verrucomicrobiae bacterium]